MTKDEALTLALEALKIWEQMYPKSSASAYRAPAITAIEEALAHDDEDAIIIQYHEATIKILEKRIEELTAQPERNMLSAWQETIAGVPVTFESESDAKRLMAYLAQPEQEPVARVIDNGTPEGTTEWIPFTNRVEPLKTGDLLYTTPPQPEQEPLDFAYVMEAGDDRWKKLPIQERNFCPRCGKRTADLTTIHTCTPPQENT